MSSTTGIQPIINYNQYVNHAAAITALAGIVPTDDATPGTGAVAGGGQGGSNTYLDEMSPAAAAQLQVELSSITANVPASAGQYTVTAADVTAGFSTIPGPTVSAPTLVNSCMSVRRAGVLQSTVLDANYTANGNNFRLASAGSYTLTAGDVVTYRLQT